MTNYRPISLLSNVDKIFEKLVHSRLTSFLDKHTIIFNRQFGFRKAYSTSLSLTALTEEIRKALDKGQFSCGVFIDLQKAFDTVDHNILLRKLELYGVRGVANNWFRSFLTGRSQYVFYCGAKSIFNEITYGVPQGSVLGPLLFLLYINDLCNALIFCNTSLFADDISIIYSHFSLKKIEKSINIDLKRLFKWLCANKISLNVAKTEVILFRDPRKLIYHNIRLRLNGNPLYFSPYVKYLGIYLDCFLSWNKHTEILKSKLCKANGIISRLRYLLPKSILISIYYALFLSHLTYACQVWGQNLNPNSQIFRLQKQCLRLLTFSDFNAPSSPLFDSLKLLKLFDIIKLQNILLISDIFKLVAPQRIIDLFDLRHYPHSYLTRGKASKLLLKPQIRTTKFGVNSIVFQSMVHWNQLQSLYPSYDLAFVPNFEIKSQFVQAALNSYLN